MLALAFFFLHYLLGLFPGHLLRPLFGPTSFPGERTLGTKLGLAMTLVYLLRWLVITCVYFDRAQICTQLNAIFFPILPPNTSQCSLHSSRFRFLLTNFFAPFCPMPSRVSRLTPASLAWLKGNENNCYAG